MRLAVLLLALAGISCGSSSWLVAIDHRMPEATERAVERGLYSWIAETGEGCFRFALGEEPDIWITEGQRVPGVNGSEFEQTIFLRPGMSPEEAEGTTRHEVGHAIGMGHVRAGVMQPAGGGPEFSDDDRAEMKRIGGCRR